MAGGARPAFVITRTIFADRRLHWAAGTILGIAVVTLLVLAMFPWGALRSMIEAQLRDRFGPAVTIGSIERLDTFSFTPTIRIRNVRIPQAEWAGRGDLARIEQADVTFRALPLLTGARGKPPVDLQRLAEAISAVSVFAAAHKDEVASVEVNPFIALPKGGCAVDALILR